MITLALVCNALLVLFLAWRLASGRLSVFSPLCLFGAGFAYFHVFRAYLLIRRPPSYLNDDILAFGLGIALFSFLSLLLGYHLPTIQHKRGPLAAPFGTRYAHRLFGWSCFFLLLYALSSVYLIRQHGGIWTWLTGMKTYHADIFYTPGHAHLYTWVNLFPAAYLLGWLAARSRPESYKWFFYAMFAWTLVVRFFFQSLIAGARGPLVLNGILLAGPSLYRKRFRLVAVIIWLTMISAGIFGELMEQTRGTYGFGQEKLLPIDLGEATPFQEKYTATDTAVYHYTRVYATWVSGQWGYGLSLPNTLWRLIPRRLWPQRPFSLQHLMLPKRYPSIEHVFGIRMPSGGPASGGIAHAFVDFGPLFFVFWFLLGVFFQKIDGSAARGMSAPALAVALTVSYAAVHLGTQGLGIFYDRLLWCTVPLIVIIRLAKSPVASRQRYRPRPPFRKARLLGKRVRLAGLNDFGISEMSQ